MVENAKKYDDWAWLYNRTLGPRYNAHKIGPLERVVLPRLPAGGALLDLCCGTGHLAASLVARGFSVTGLDGSADMLRYAQENAPQAQFVEGDARYFQLETKFDGVICASASLNHMETLDDLRAVFTSVNRALKPGGVFVFDVNHPAQMARYWRGAVTEGELQADHAWTITPRYDAGAARGSFTVDIYRRAGKGAPLKDMADRLARHRLLSGWRLARLARYGAIRPNWEHHSIVNSVSGHDLAAVTAALSACGFDAQLHSTGGGPVDDSHAAYFFCRKTAEVQQSGEPAQKEAAQ